MNDNKVVISIDADTSELEEKLERIKKLLGDIKESVKELKKLITSNEDTSDVTINKKICWWKTNFRRNY